MSASRTARIAHAWGLPVTPILPAPHRAPAAGVDTLPASAAFFHSPWGQGDTAPADNPKPTPAGAVTLSDHAMILLRAIAAYEQVDDAAALTMALAAHATKIGAGPLARACLDEIERCGALTDNREPKRVDCRVGGVNADPAGALANGDLHAVPDFRRVGETRFPRGGP